MAAPEKQPLDRIERIGILIVALALIVGMLLGIFIVTFALIVGVLLGVRRWRNNSGAEGEIVAAPEKRPTTWIERIELIVAMLTLLVTMVQCSIAVPAYAKASNLGREVAWGARTAICISSLRIVCPTDNSILHPDAKAASLGKKVAWGARMAMCVSSLRIVCPTDNSILHPEADQREVEDDDDSSSSSDDQLSDCDSANPAFPCVYMVRRGDSLASISKRWYGSERYADLICSTNSSFLQERYEYDLTTAWQEVFRSPCRYIDSGWRLVLPSLSTAAGD
jgi:hypothetical protein